MNELLTLGIVFVTTLGSTFLSTLSGGGAAIIALPIFLALGLPLLLAVAVLQVDATFWVVPASYNYLHGRKIDWKFIVTAGLIGTIGAVAGVLFLHTVPQRTFETVFGAVILLLVAYLALNKGFGLKKVKTTKQKAKYAYLAMPFLGAYEIVFGSGNGTFFSILGVKLRGYELTEALGYYYAVALPWCLIGAFMLVSGGNYDVNLMVVALVGSLIGAYAGSRLGRYKGSSFVKAVFCVLGAVLGLKLLFGL